MIATMLNGILPSDPMAVPPIYNVSMSISDEDFDEVLARLTENLALIRQNLFYPMGDDVSLVVVSPKDVLPAPPPVRAHPQEIEEPQSLVAPGIRNSDKGKQREVDN